MKKLNVYMKTPVKDNKDKQAFNAYYRMGNLKPEDNFPNNERVLGKNRIEVTNEKILKSLVNKQEILMNKKFFSTFQYKKRKVDKGSNNIEATLQLNRFRHDIDDRTISKMSKKTVSELVKLKGVINRKIPIRPKNDY